MISRAGEAQMYLVVGVIDMDNLKNINDVHGHPAGDQALRDVASVLTNSVQPDWLAARIGGDEFIVVFPSDVTDPGGTLSLIQTAVVEQCPGNSVSVGGVVWGIDGETFDDCYRTADVRLYDDKRARKVNQSGQ
ncbi:GGDEF domain-containing protein [Alicyclobacillus dauci]|uniref:GGDEF domain-containing protein n=1 Tax=Alicyclobacillus dauci TaxID=1475485 RepID=A0ABY6YYY8_9BACL|nr:GGDEF domain-containing protein [Alicyclobacillus dauci]WAH35294.1 GGDEF domain-containing protein [Alicyclobacillus dauci]